MGLHIAQANVSLCVGCWQGETRFGGSYDWHHQWCGGINGDEYADHDGSVVIESCFRQLGPAAAMCCGQAESRICAAANVIGPGGVVVLVFERVFVFRANATSHTLV